MSNGALIIAHNSDRVDYSSQAIVSASLAKKHLGIPVSLVTDSYTFQWMKEHEKTKKYLDIFDKIIEIDVRTDKNKRRLHDGFHGEIVPFNNDSRSMVWDLTPYEKTLLLDSDFLIFSDRLNEYWDIDSSVLISKAMNDVKESRAGLLDKWISYTGSNLYWATTVMFTKNEESKFFFDLVNSIKTNYNYYSELYRFDSKMYRNDISFSIAKHIINGFTPTMEYCLPDIVTTSDKDTLIDVKDDGRLIFLIDNDETGTTYSAMSTKGIDLHVMNKQSIVRNFEKLMDLV